MAQFNIYITDRLPEFGDYPTERGILQQLDADVHLLEGGLGPDELARRLADAHAVMIRHAPIDARILAAMPHCRVVVRYGVGVDTIDLDAATQSGIIVAHHPDFCIEEVGNHALLLMLACVKKLIPLHGLIREGGWRPQSLAPMQHLHGQTLGLVACGNIARAFAKRAHALSMRVIGYDPYIDPHLAAAAEIELVPTLDDLLAQADVVSLHTPLTAETRHLIDATALAKMKPTAYLLNTSRGAVIDQAALGDALRDGRIAGAGLDVFETEPPLSDSPLRRLDTVVLTPHTASYSNHAFQLLSGRVADSVVHVLSGHWPRFVANKAILQELDLQPCPDPP